MVLFTVHTDVDTDHGQLSVSFFSPPFMHGLPSGEIPVVPHVGWSNLYLEELLPKLSIPKAPGENNANDKIYNQSVGLEMPSVQPR